MTWPVKLKYTLYSVCFYLLLAGSAAASDALKIRYELDLTFTPGNKQPSFIKGSNRVWVKNNWDRSLGELHFHNSSNGYFDARNKSSPSTVIGEVRGSHRGRTTNIETSSMQVGLFPALNPGEETMMEIPFTTRLSGDPNSYVPTVGTQGDTTIYSLVYFYPVLEFFHADGWHPWEYDQKNEPLTNLAEYQVNLTYPVGYQVGASGYLTAVDTITDGMVRSSYHLSQAVNFSMVISNKFIRHQEAVDGLSVEFLVTPGDEARISEATGLLTDLIMFYQDRFGPCPNDKLTVATGYSLDATAITNSNIIIFQEGLTNGLSALPHEFAHQWFGNGVIADETIEVWLIESFAEYAALLYRRFSNPQEKQNIIKSGNELLAIWKDLEKLSAEEIMRRLYHLFGRSVFPPAYRENRQTRWENRADMYSRYIIGTHSLQMLESAVGDSQMQAIMYDYVTENNWKYVNTETFIQAVDKVTNDRISTDFRLALTTNLRPDYKIISVESKGRKDRRWETKIKTEVDGSWVLPVDLRTVTEVGDTIRHERIRLQNNGEINMITSSPVKSVVLDPDKLTFDSNRFNNRWPRSYLLQPIYGLPSWEVYKLYYRPVLREDWRREWRFGVHVSGGLGLNLMPLLPAFFHNSFDLELNFSPEIPKHQLGLKLAYRTPLGSIEHTFWEVRSSWEYPRNEQSLSVSWYVGKTRYLVANRQSAYQRVTGQLKRTEFVTTDPDNNRWLRGQLLSIHADFIRFRYKPQQRSNIQLAFLAGEAINQQGGTFYRVSGLVDFERHLWESLIARTHVESGLVWDERTSNYLRYKLEHQLRAWKSRTDFVPLFRGFSPVSKNYWDSVLGFGFSLGIETKQPAWPMIYVDGAIAEDGGGNLKHRWDRLGESPVYASAGIGIESQSLVELGLYMPLWISHPFGNNSRWGWRWLVQVGFYF